MEFDFLGKDSIRYYNKVSVEKRVFKNLEIFMQNKSGEDDLFDRLNVSFDDEILVTSFIHTVSRNDSKFTVTVSEVNLFKKKLLKKVLTYQIYFVYLVDVVDKYFF